MSKENRRKEYDRLMEEGNLDQDDGSLIKEFGKPKIEPEEEPIIVPNKPEEEKPKRGKK